MWEEIGVILISNLNMVHCGQIYAYIINMSARLLAKLVLSAVVDNTNCRCHT